MSIVVQKYGGSSVANAEKIKVVAQRIARTRAGGHAVCVVVSAMGDTTDELLALAKEVTGTPERRELDMLLTAGERISMALLSLALNDLGVHALSFTGSQSGIITNDSHANARIVEVRPYRLQDELERGNVVIVAGYQGVSYKKEVTTLGRGGSDTTAVALAAALGAEYCEICSDVDGVYSADPRVVPAAQKLADLSYEEMQTLAESGAKVLNAQAVEFAREKGIALYARATFVDGPGTRIAAEPLRRLDAPAGPGRVRAIASEAEVVLLTVWDASPEDFAALAELADRQGLASESARLDAQRATLVVGLENAHRLPRVIEDAKKAFADRLRLEDGYGCVSCVGHGINGSHENLRRALEALREARIQVARAETAPERIGLFVEREKVPDAVQALHRRLVGS